ncbi:MAG: type IV pilus modification protein PilV [Thiohalomonadales bacterium]
MKYSIKQFYKFNYTGINYIANQGFSLLEVMIAMVIFAVGVLGLAGMQVIALENSFESSSRNQAIILAYSMSDRMIANRQAHDGYIISNSATLALNSTTCSTAICSSDEIVIYDQSQWKQNLSQQLVSGSGEITGVFPNYTVTVRWDEDRSGATGINCPPLGVNDLRCFQLGVQLWK